MERLWGRKVDRIGEETQRGDDCRRKVEKAGGESKKKYREDWSRRDEEDCRRKIEGLAYTIYSLFLIVFNEY